MLPMDVLIDILKRLPGRSLMRFKCVCKLWFALITDPEFAELHHSNAKERGGNGGILLIPPPDCVSSLCILDLKKEPRERVSVLEPFLPCGTKRMTNVVEGLICFYAKRSIYLYNLTTHESLPLPQMQVTYPWDKIMRSCFLAFDQKAKKYKVLQFQEPYYCDEVEVVDCQVFVVGGKDSGWRPIDISYISTSFTSIRKRPGRGPPVCLDGLLCWRAGPGIIAFDVADEKFEVINLPEEVTIRSRLTIAQVQGLLTLFQIETSAERSGAIKITWWELGLGDNNHKDTPLWTRHEIFYQFPFFKPLWSRCTPFGQVFSVRNPKSDQCIIDCYDLATGKHEELEVNNAHGIFYSVHMEFRPSKFFENIFPLKNI